MNKINEKNSKKTKIHIKTYGCSFNQLDSEIIAGILAKKNYEIIDDDINSDLIIINSCSVKNLAESKLFNDIKKYGEQNRKIVVCGCVPQAEISYLNTKLKDISVIGINDLDKIEIVVSETLKGNIKQIVSELHDRKENESQRVEKEQLRLLTKKQNQNKLVEIIPINEGCLNFCTYCKTKYARGNLFSYSIENIKIAFENAVKNGAKEIYLTSQDTACYGFDINTNLPNLLRELLTIKGDYKIRIGMGNPNHFIKIIDEVLEIMKSDERIYRFLHIPMQSGNNRILDEMKRMYNVETYLKIIQKARKEIPQITIANDIIVAYPTETEEEFLDTIKIMKSGGTDVLNFSRFWLRPNTPCETLHSKKDFIEGTISKERSSKLKSEFEKLAVEQNSKWIGWEGEVTVTEIGKVGTNSYVARNNYYKPIIIKIKDNEKLKIGQKVNMKITEVTWFDFRGELI